MPDIFQIVAQWLNIKYEAVFAVLTPIFVLLLGHAINTTSKWYARNKKLKERNIYFTALLNAIAAPITRQAASVRTLVAKLRTPDDTPTFDNKSHIHLEDLHSFPKEESFQLCVRTKRGKVQTNVTTFNEMRRQTDITLKLIGHLRKAYYDYISKVSPLQAEYDSNLDNILEHIDAFRNSFESNHALFDLLTDISAQLADRDFSLRSASYAVIVEPLMRYSARGEQQADQVRPLFSALFKCFNSYARILTIRSTYAGMFDGYALKLDDMAVQLEKTATSLKSRKTKFIYRAF